MRPRRRTTLPGRRRKARGPRPHAHCRSPRGHGADRLVDRQRLYRLLQDDAVARRARHRRRARRPGGRGLRLQLQRPLRPGRADPRALRAAARRGRPEIAARRRRRQSRSRPHLGDADEEREAGRPRRALGRGRHDRHGGVGRDRENRRQAAVPAARRAPRRRRRAARSSSTPPAVLLPRQGHRGAARRDAQLSRSRLHRGEDEDRQLDRRGPPAYRSRARPRSTARHGLPSTPMAA